MFSHRANAEFSKMMTLSHKPRVGQREHQAGIHGVPAVFGQTPCLTQSIHSELSGMVLLLFSETCLCWWGPGAHACNANKKARHREKERAAKEQFAPAWNHFQF